MRSDELCWCTLVTDSLHQSMHSKAVIYLPFNAAFG